MTWIVKKLKLSRRDSLSAIRPAATKTIALVALACALSVGEFRQSDAQTGSKRTDSKTKVVYGNISITDFSVGSLDLSKKTKKPRRGDFNGRPRFEITNPKTGATYVIIADRATGEGLDADASKNSATVELKGRLEYVLSQPSENGIQVVRGVADSGTYRQAAQELVLNRVRAQANDPRQTTADTLRADRATVDLKSKPYAYRLSGSASGSDLRFTPVATVPKAGDAPPKNAVRGEIHLHGFTNGTYQPGEIATVKGDESEIEFTDESTSTEIVLKAGNFQAEFSPETKTVVKMEAWSALKYHLKSPAPKLKQNEKPSRGEQELNGTGEKISYDLSGKTLTLTGAIDATLKESLRLLEPARLKASRLFVKTEGSPNYVLTGNSSSLLEFQPRPIKSDKTEPKPDSAKSETDSLDNAPEANVAKEPTTPSQTFLAGKVRLTGFQNAEFEPGKQLDCEAAAGQNLLLETNDPGSFSLSKVTTHRFQATLSEGGGIVNATSKGALDFFVQQRKPTPKKKTLAGVRTVQRKSTAPPPTILQSFAGVASNLNYDGETQQLTLEGPYDTSFTDPELFTKPLKLVGAKGDSMSRLFKEERLIFNSPNKTSSIDGTPVPVVSKSTPSTLSKPEKKKE